MSKLQDKPKVSLEIHKIPNPTTQPREPVKPVAISMNHVDVAKVNNPNDKNTTVNLTEKQKLVLYPRSKGTRYGNVFRDHDMMECRDVDSQCDLHKHFTHAFKTVASRSTRPQTAG